MDVLKRHIGVFDFWSIFGAGTVILISYILLLSGKSLEKCSDNIAQVAYYIALAYVVGLILYCTSSIFANLPLVGLNASRILKGAIRRKGQGKASIFRSRYIDRFPIETLENYNAQYDILKLYGVPPRVDKLHSIFGMARGISVGYIVLALISLDKKPLLISGLFAVLSIMFYVIARKYLYRWIEWIFQEYEYLTETISGDEKADLLRVYNASKKKYKEYENKAKKGERNEKNG